MRLTRHFTQRELTKTDTGLDNRPRNFVETRNLYMLATALEQVRKLLGDEPITVTSAFRSEEVNRAVGGVW